MPEMHSTSRTVYSLSRVSTQSGVDKVNKVVPFTGDQPLHIKSSLRSFWPRTGMRSCEFMRYSAPGG